MTMFLDSRRAATVTLAALIGVAGFASTAAAQNVELRMATLAPTGSRWEKALTEGSAKVAAETEGRVTVKYFADAIQGDERDVVRKINQGQLDGGAVTAVGLSMIDSSIRVLELPRMFHSVEEMDFVRKKMWKYFQKKFEKKGFMLGAEGDVGPVYFMSKKEVKTLADLKNLKVWRWSDDVVVEKMYAELGIVGVPLGVPEVDANLSSGGVTAAYGPPLAAMTLGWGGKVKFITDMQMSYAIGATLIKLDAFHKLSKEDQKKVKKITNDVSKKLRKHIRKDNDGAEKEMKRKGVKVTKVDPAMVKEFDAAAERVWKSQVGKLYSQEELDMVLKHRDEYRAKKGK